MTVNLFTFVGMYSHALDTANSLLDKGATHAAAAGVSENEMLGWRLYEDMNPLSFQIAYVCNMSRQWLARAAGVEVPPDVSDDLDVAGYKAVIAETKAFIGALKPEQFEGRDEVSLTVKFNNGLEPTLPVERWISVFATTNLYFHLTTAYGVLRKHGVQIGKADMFAAGL